MHIDFGKLSDCINEEVLAHLCYKCNKCKRFDKKEKKITCRECGSVNYYMNKKGFCIDCYNDLEINEGSGKNE